MSSEHDVEVTNLWSLFHAVASGCISIEMWEVVKECNLGPAGSWAVFLTASVALLHAVHRHRRAVFKAQMFPDPDTEYPDDGAAVTHEPHE